MAYVPNIFLLKQMSHGRLQTSWCSKPVEKGKDSRVQSDWKDCASPLWWEEPSVCHHNVVLYLRSGLPWHIKKLLIRSTWQWWGVYVRGIYCGKAGGGNQINITWKAKFWSFSDFQIASQHAKIIISGGLAYCEIYWWYERHELAQQENTFFASAICSKPALVICFAISQHFWG